MVSCEVILRGQPEEDLSEAVSLCAKCESRGFPVISGSKIG
jgi:hypothetical protein